MNLSEFVFWLGSATLLMYFGAVIYILTGVALAYYRRRK